MAAGHARIGPDNAAWRGGTKHHRAGYVLRWVPDHPNATREGYVMEHRLVMAQHLGRALRAGEIVHHLDGDKANNAIGNLCLVTRHTHARHHPQKPEGRWAQQYDACTGCGRSDVPHNAGGLCISCYSNRRYHQPKQRWARDHDACVACGEATQRHIARGLCAHCYYQARGWR